MTCLFITISIYIVFEYLEMTVVAIEDMEGIVKNEDQIVEEDPLVVMTVTVVPEEADINGIIKRTM